tara:strand:- start:171 stop:326 length:156 start_codon:yes stop_codon:yes gene_type:complete
VRTEHLPILGWVIVAWLAMAFIIQPIAIWAFRRFSTVTQITEGELDEMGAK